MKKASKKKNALRSAGVGRLNKKTRLLLIVFFAIGASLAAYSTFALTSPTGGPAAKPGSSGSPPAFVACDPSQQGQDGCICFNGTCTQPAANTSPDTGQPASASQTGSADKKPPKDCSQSDIDKAKVGEHCYFPSASSSCSDAKSCLTGSPIVKDINQIINFLSAGVGIIVIGVIVFGGIQYIAAGNKPDAVAAAHQRIANGFIALGVFIVIYAFLQWLVPGGIFG